MKTATAKKTARNSTRRAAVAAARKPAASKARAPLLGEHPVPAAKTASEKKAPRTGTRWGLAWEMLIKGATNAELLAALRKAFGKTIPTTYPRWYRSYAVKHGHITKAWAVEHQGPAVASSDDAT